MSVLGDRLLAVHAALSVAGLPHAFGGAIALAYCTEEPRGTRDIDVNVFVPALDAARVLAALGGLTQASASDIAQAERDGQIRVWIQDTPLDLFFDVHDFHRQAVLSIRTVPFEGVEIPVLGCTTLVVFKAMFGRTKDWADIEEMEAARAINTTTALGWLVRVLGPDAYAVRRLREITTGDGNG